MPNPPAPPADAALLRECADEDDARAGVFSDPSRIDHFRTRARRLRALAGRIEDPRVSDAMIDAARVLWECHFRTLSWDADRDRTVPNAAGHRTLARRALTAALEGGA
jgi:hypothetical protein